MNKKDVANFRKQLKLDNDLLRITDIFNVYVRKESNEVYHYESHPFSLLDREQQELFMANFKKVLTGQLDIKLFELKFQTEIEMENHTRNVLHGSLQLEDIDDWIEQMLLMVEKMFKNRQYEMDVVVSFIRGTFFQPLKKKNEATEDNERDEVTVHPFILCSINKTEQPKKTLLFDFIGKEFKSHVVVDAVINLTAPLGGFLYPCFTDGYSDVNHILYCSGKANEPDYYLIEDVLNGEAITTAMEEKVVFEEIVKHVVGEQVNAETLANVYEEINQMIEVEKEEGEEEPRLDYKDVERVLKASGVENVDIEKVEAAFQTVIDDESYELKATSILPKYNSKSIKISTKVANIAISPQDLKYIRQVTVNGKKCVLIEVEEDIDIEGFKLIPETLLS
ncbi:DUF4317 domain-containing protein [Bacillus kwashiorkori]|uniref:DUF4317 domain-containing protein n=1 Tax=Bacillus kwashiorkori TaxID=1522318 RepID=UPI000783CA30|nr:DUF4317 domain-containing protein [Bacillus kwashiorkori]